MATSSITKTTTIAASPTTARATAVHLSYDKRTDRICYASGKSIYVRSLSAPEQNAIQFNGHNYLTTVAKISPSGYYVASGDESGKVKIWSLPQTLDNDAEEIILKGDYQIINGRINDLSWDADSTRIIAVGDGKERYGHCFTFDSGNSIGEISGHTAPINAASIKPTRPYRAVTVSDDAGLVFMSGPPFKFSNSVRGQHNNFVRDVKFSPKGDYIASVGADRVIVLYDGKTGEVLKKMENCHDGGLFGVDWVDDNTFITCSADCSIKLWNVEGDCLQQWSLEKKLENQLLGCLSANDYIVGLSFSGDFYYFDKASESPVKVLYGHSKSITALAVIGDELVTGSYDGRLITWDLETKKSELIKGEEHTNLVVDIKPTDGNSLLTTAWDDNLKKVTNCEIRQLSSLSSQPIQMASSEDKYSIITEDSLILLDSNGSELKKVALDYSPSSIAISSKYIIVTDSIQFSFNVYDLATLSLVPNTLQPMRSKPTSLAISSNELYLACGDSTGKINCYDLSTFALITSRWSFHTAKINSMEWNVDNDHLVSCSLDTNIIIYSRLKPMRNIKGLNCHKEGVNSVGWLANGGIVSAGVDSCLKFWDVRY